MDKSIDEYDVAIAGAGPAGSSAAIRLAKAGLRVLLVEQKKFPRQKLCGEFISPECLAHFQDLGVLSDISAANGTALYETVFYARNGKSAAIQSNWFGGITSSALGLSRAEMDARLMEQARSVGVTVLEEVSVIGPLFNRDHVVGLALKDQKGNAVEIGSTIAIDATGRNRALARRFDEKNTKQTPAEYVAFKAHFRNAKLNTGACEIYVYDGGYGGCNKIEAGLYNLCFIVSAKQTKSLGSDPGLVMREVLFRNQRAAEVLQNAEVVSEWLAVPISNYGRFDLASIEGLIAIGDAAAFIDPFTGSGILLALDSGKLAADIIFEGLKEGHQLGEISTAYRCEHTKRFNARLRLCEILRHTAYKPFLAERIIAILSYNSGLRRSIARATRSMSGHTR